MSFFLETGCAGRQHFRAQIHWLSRPHFRYAGDFNTVALQCNFHLPEVELAFFVFAPAAGQRELPSYLVGVALFE